MVKRVIVLLVGLSIVFALVVWGAGRGWFGSHEEPGQVTETARSPEVVAGRAERACSAEVWASKLIGRLLDTRLVPVAAPLLPALKKAVAIGTGSSYLLVTRNEGRRLGPSSAGPRSHTAPRNAQRRRTRRFSR